MTMGSSNAMRRNRGISALRGIFIIMIVLHHLNLYDGGGTLGVAFFFMLGGFVLSLGYYDKVRAGDFSYVAFVRRRCAKFFPLHWLCLLAAIPLALIPAIRGGADIKTVLVPFLPNALLLQSLIPIKAVYFSFNAVSWYLSDTLLFAFAFPFIVKCLERLDGKGRLMALSIILVAYTVLVYFLPVQHRHAILYISPLVRVVDFVLGIYLYLLYREISARHIGRRTDVCLSMSLTVLMLAVAVMVSCIASEDTVLISAIYWMPLAMILMSTALSSEVGG